MKIFLLEELEEDCEDRFFHAESVVIVADNEAQARAFACADPTEDSLLKKGKWLRAKCRMIGSAFPDSQVKRGVLIWNRVGE